MYHSIQTFHFLRSKSKMSRVSEMQSNFHSTNHSACKITALSNQSLPMNTLGIVWCAYPYTQNYKILCPSSPSPSSFSFSSSSSFSYLWFSRCCYRCCLGLLFILIRQGKGLLQFLQYCTSPPPSSLLFVKSQNQERMYH